LIKPLLSRLTIFILLVLMAAGGLLARPAGSESRPDSGPATTASARTDEAIRRRIRIAKLHARSLALARESKWDQCREVLDEILQLNPEDPIGWYNTACVLSRLARTEGALDALNKAVEVGYAGIVHMERDPDLEALRETEGYRRILARRDEIQRERAERIREQLQDRFGEDYIVEVDPARRLVFATDIDREVLEDLKTYLTAHAEALWGELFDHRFDQYVTIIIPKEWKEFTADADRTYPAGFYNRSFRLLVCKSVGMVLAHEFTHALHDADQDALADAAGQRQKHPIWITEGLATLYESSSLKGRRLVPEPNRRLLLLKRLARRKKTIPFEEFFEIDHPEFMKRSMTCYPQSRYMMMYLHRKGLLKEWYDAYTAGYDADPTGRAALEKVFDQSLARIESDWINWVRTLPKPTLRLPPRSAYLGVQVRPQPPDGLRIRRVVRGSGANKAGLRPGDVILSIDDERVAEPEALIRIVDRQHVGDKVIVRYRRGERYDSATVTLGAMPGRKRPKPTPRPKSQPAP
jgi:hypothetical protein